MDAKKVHGISKFSNRRLRLITGHQPGGRGPGGLRAGRALLLGASRAFSPDPDGGARGARAPLASLFLGEALWRVLAGCFGKMFFIRTRRGLFWYWIFGLQLFG